MDIAEEIVAVQRRMAHICGETFDGSAGVAASADTFQALVTNRLPFPSTPISHPDVAALAVRIGARYGVEPALIEAIVGNESGYDPKATSPAGARGLMQLMPATARSLRVGDPYDPEQNVAGGTRYLRGLLDRFGRVDLAVAAYNAGPNAVKRYGGIPPFAETQAYVRAVLADYRKRLQDGNVTTNGGSQQHVSIVP